MFPFSLCLWGWSGGAKVLGKLSVPERPTSLDDSRARACCACSRCEWGFVWTFFSLIYLFSFLSPSLWETARYRLKYCLKGPLNPKQQTNPLSVGNKIYRPLSFCSAWGEIPHETGATCLPWVAFRMLEKRVLVVERSPGISSFSTHCFGLGFR